MRPTLPSTSRILLVAVLALSLPARAASPKPEAPPSSDGWPRVSKTATAT
jgi:hypothetical protein